MLQGRMVLISDSFALEEAVSCSRDALPFLHVTCHCQRIYISYIWANQQPLRLPYVDCISQSQTRVPFGYDPFLTRYRGCYHVLPVIYHPFHTCYIGSLLRISCPLPSIPYSLPWSLPRVTRHLPSIPYLLPWSLLRISCRLPSIP
jgi:hypothetical protein